jgi:hypothetical protein
MEVRYVDVASSIGNPTLVAPTKHGQRSNGKLTAALHMGLSMLEETDTRVINFYNKYLLC